MIARTWHGQTNRDHADDYTNHLKQSVVPELDEIAGFRGMLVLRRETEQGCDFGVLTLWDSMDAIRQFAGDNPDVAVIEPAARAVLTTFDNEVRHHEVALRHGV